MDLASAVALERLAVRTDRISLVLGEAVSRIARVELHHAGVARRHWTRQRAHPGFVHAGDVQDSRRPKLALVTQNAAQPLPLGTMLAPASLDRAQDRSRRSAAVLSKPDLDGLRQRSLAVDVAP